MADLTEVDQEHSKILSEIEADLHSIAEPELEMELSINEWLQRVQGAGTEAKMYARSGQVLLEEAAWRQLASIAVRRIATIRRLDEIQDVSPDPEGV